eukprot:PhM_4_TR9166/c0_g1_i1/m.94505/K09527/DNAJC7; DnaJ homolog subfamily C member 7
MSSRRNAAATHNNEGNISYRKKKYADAIESYTSALQLQPDFAVVYANRAQALLQQRRFSLAVEDNLTSVKLDPLFWQGQIRAGKCYVQLGRLDEAWECFQEVAQRFSERKNGEATQVAEFELTRLQWLRDVVQTIETHYADGAWGICERLILETEEYVSQSFHLKMMLCECQYRRRHYMHVLKSVEKIREYLPLTEREKQAILNMELKSYAAMIVSQQSTKKSVTTPRRYASSEPGALYDVLEVTSAATDDDISQAYSRLAMQHHPGQHGNASAGQRSDTRQRFLEVTEAFVVLGDPMMRSLYDAGYSVEEILCEDIHPDELLCGGARGPKSKASESFLSKAARLLTSPIVAVVGCPVATAWCVKRRVEKPADEDFWVQEKLRQVHMKRQAMLRNCASRRAEAAANANDIGTLSDDEV